MTRPVVYLMRGLPSTGKSTAARRLAGETGAVFETDSFFMTEVGDDPNAYDYDRERLTEARDWNFERFKDAVDKGDSPIVVDRGNSLSPETKRYAVYAAERDYRVELAEPDSTWWQEIRVLLKYKRVTGVVLVAWARQLAKLSWITHRVPVRDILRQMSRWKYDLTVEEIMTFEPADIARQEAGGDASRPPAGTVTAVSHEKVEPDAVIGAIRDLEVSISTTDEMEGAADSGADAWTFDEGEDVFIPLTGQSEGAHEWPDIEDPSKGGSTTMDIDGNIWVSRETNDAVSGQEEDEGDNNNGDRKSSVFGKTG